MTEAVGDDRTRTDHPLIANQMLYQMSYAPNKYFLYYSIEIKISTVIPSRPHAGIRASTGNWRHPCRDKFLTSKNLRIYFLCAASMRRINYNFIKQLCSRSMILWLRLPRKFSVRSRSFSMNGPSIRTFMQANIRFVKGVCLRPSAGSKSLS